MNSYIRSVSFALLLSIILSFFASCGPRSIDLFIFSDMSEMEALASDEHFDKYENPSADYKLRDLRYEVAVCGEYSSDELSFEIFAYEFISAAVAKQYFENVTGKRAPDQDVNFSGSWGRTKFELAVIYDERAYYVRTDVSKSKELEAFLGRIFSVKLDNYF